jgi:hypothetical protein
MTATTVPRTQDLSEGAPGLALLHIERGDLASAPVGTVRSRLSHARAELAQALAATPASARDDPVSRVDAT